MSERSRVRRRDRAMDDAWVRAFLEAAPFGFLATVADGQPFLNSNLFVYDPDRHALYLHTARTGRVNENLGADRPRPDVDSRPRDADPPRPPTAPVCFSVAT
ncbi:MAG TPA: pyridoxamine 5'-phosphate oxidase family protein, partial [Longimicrobiales bacterium]|nr:pyridoxamine 5'-phosphate oxidase family protein [Longimicrobiales bacterium]